LSTRARRLAARRADLLVRSDSLRAVLVDEAAALAGRFGLADQLIAVGRSGFTQVAVVAGVLWVVLGRPGRVLRLASRVVMLWPLLRPLVPHVVRLIRAR
jgi:hypothetical protein